MNLKIHNDADGDGMMTSLSMPLLASATSIDIGAANTINLEDQVHLLILIA